MLGRKILDTLLSRFEAEPLQVEGLKCINARSKYLVCSLCQEACPTGALTLKDSGLALETQPQLEAESCVSCGICVGVCPTEVFTLGKTDVLQFQSVLDKFLTLARSMESGDKTSLLFVCRQARGSFFEEEQRRFLSPPCLAALNLSDLLYAAAKAARSLSLYVGECTECPLASSFPLVERLVGSARALLTIFERNIQVNLIKEKDSIQSEVQRCDFSGEDSPNLLTRADLFLMAKKEALKTTAQLVGSYLAEHSSEGKEPPNRAHLVPRRRLWLLKTLRSFGGPKVRMMDLDLLPFANFLIGEGCNGCTICAALCPTRALERGEGEEEVVLNFTPAHCLDCHLCEKACPESAIFFLPQIESRELTNVHKRMLKTILMSVCATCGQKFLPYRDSIYCSSCSKFRSL